ncbi:MAG: D-arabinono-1,4-lactone oxidase [Planctomycetota bacterium]
MKIRRPANEAEVVELVRAAARSGVGLRVVGSRHSAPAAYATTGSAISLDRLRAIRDLPGDRVEVEAGVVLTDLCHHLESRGLALPNLGGITAQTAAGFVATGSEGGSLRYGFGASVARLRIVTATGAVVDIDRDHPWFDAAGVSLGLLGVITAITLDCVPSFGVAGTEEYCDFATLHANFARIAEESDYARALWYPGIAACRLWRADRTARLDRAVGVERLSPLTQHLANAANFIGSRARNLVARPLWRLFVSRASRRFRGPWCDVLPQDEGLSLRRLPHVYSELWLPIECAEPAMAAVAESFERGGLHSFPTLPVEFYTAPASRYWLNPGYRRASFRINFIHYGHDPHSPEQMFAGPWETLARFNPRAHWGKYHVASARALAVSCNLPRFSDFVALRHALDPNDVFLTTYWARFCAAVAAPARTPNNTLERSST